MLASPCSPCSRSSPLATAVVACGSSSDDGADGKEKVTRRARLDAEHQPLRASTSPRSRAGTTTPGWTCRSWSPARRRAPQLLAAGKADLAVSVQEEIIPARAAGPPGRVDRRRSSSTTRRASCPSSRRHQGVRPTSPGKTYGGLRRPAGAGAGQAAHRRAAAVTPTRCESVDVGEADYRIGPRPRNQYDVRLDLRRLGRHPPRTTSTSCRLDRSRSSTTPTASPTGTRRSSPPPRR